MLNSFHFLHSSSFWWMPTLCLAQFYALGDNKVCTLVSLYSKEEDRRFKMVISVCWKWKWSNEIVRMPGGDFRRVGRKGTSKEVFKLWSEWQEGSSWRDHVNLHVNWTCFIFLEGAYFQWPPTTLRICNQHTCIKIAASESFCMMCYFVVKIPAY